MVALGMHRVRGDDAPGQVQGLQERRELGDLIGLAVHASLAEHGTSLLIEDSQQVHGLPVTAGMTGAPHRLAVNGQRLPPAPAVASPLASSPQPGGEPGSQSGIERGSIH